MPNETEARCREILVSMSDMYKVSVQGSKNMVSPANVTPTYGKQTSMRNVEKLQEYDEKNLVEDEKHAEETAQVRGLPYETCMSRENPELSGNIISIAPAEDEKPIPLLTENFEELSNPDKYPDGKNGLTATRPIPIQPCKYFNQRLLDCDGRFAKSI